MLFEIIQLAVMTDVRVPLSLQNVEDPLHERDIDICHENTADDMMLESFLHHRQSGLGLANQTAASPSAAITAPARDTAG